MNFFKRISIRNKVLVLVVIIVVPVIIGQAILTIYRNNVNEKAEMLANYEHLTRVTAEYSSVDLVFGDKEEALKSISQLLVVEDVLEVTIFDLKGNKFAYQKIPEKFDVIYEVEKKNGTLFKDNVLMIHQKIDSEGEKVGSIFVVISTNKLKKRLQGEAVYTILVCVALLIIVIVMSFVLQKYISDPILQLTSFTKRVAKSENYSLRGVKATADEIADLTDGVNQMLEKIQSSTVSKDFMFAIIENMTNAFAILNNDGVITEVNAAMVKMFGKSSKELIGFNIQNLIESDKFLFNTNENFIEAYVGKTPVEYSTFSVDADNVVCVIHDLTRRKQYEKKIKLALKEKEALIKEIHHRVKNNLQIMSSLMNLQANDVGNPEVDEVFNKSKSRIYSMALIHAKLYQTEDLISIDVKDYVETLAQEIIRTYNVNIDLKLNITTQVKSFGIDVLVPMGLMFNELIINTIKYAFPDVNKGKINIDFKDSGDGVYTMIYSDNGVGLPAGFDLETSKTLGMRLVKIFTEQLDGQVELGKNQTGFKIIVSFKKELAYPE